MNRQVTGLLAAIAVCFMLLCAVFPTPASAQSPDAVVRAVLFYSPSCGHCHYVIQEVLPPLFQKYGDQLEIVGVDITQPNGLTLYQNAIERFQIPSERLGVPTLIVGEVNMVGDQEIPDLFPGLIEQYLAEGGMDWPDIPGLREAMAIPTPAEVVEATPASTESVPVPTPISEPALVIPEGSAVSWQEKFALDPTGNTLSVAVLAAMLVALAWTVYYLLRPGSGLHADRLSWLIPALCLVGLIVAGYLSYVETTNTAAVCGPVGDCNTVQQSPYAQLFGILPVGVLGLSGYMGIILGWAVTRYGNGVEVSLATLAVLGMTLAGTLFSIYLTFLEPFVIGATCAWCLTSSVLMTVLMLLSIPSGKQAAQSLLRKRGR